MSKSNQRFQTSTLSHATNSYISSKKSPSKKIITRGAPLIGTKSSLFFQNTKQRILSTQNLLIKKSFLNKQEKVFHAKNAMNLSQKSIRSEEHTSELQSRFDLVCRLL